MTLPTANILDASPEALRDEILAAPARPLRRRHGGSGVARRVSQAIAQVTARVM